jgi:hypothetical protein
LARLLGYHDRLGASEVEDELVVVDQMGAVEVRELSHPLGQDSSEGLERLNGKERIEHVEGSEVRVSQRHLPNEGSIKDQSPVVGRGLGFFARF